MINHIDYQGETINLSRTYSDFHEYRDDPHNLPDNEVSRVATLLKEAAIPSRFANLRALEDHLLTIMFPGYGLSISQLDQPVVLANLEVPRMEEDRWITLVLNGEEWFVVDDFAWSVAHGYIRAAAYDGRKLCYYDASGALVRQK
jgi:hypothetical protein